MARQSLSPAPLSASDVDALTRFKASFVHGHTDDDINKVLDAFTGTRLVCVWDCHDEWGFGGNSEIIGRPTDPSADQSWRRLSSEVTEFLYDHQCDLDPETIASMLDTTGTFAVYEEQDIDALDGDGLHNVTLDAQVPVA